VKHSKVPKELLRKAIHITEERSESIDLELHRMSAYINKPLILSYLPKGILDTLNQHIITLKHHNRPINGDVYEKTK